MPLPDHIPAWLPTSVPVRRATLPPHMTHEWILDLRRRWLSILHSYDGADRLIIMQMVRLPWWHGDGHVVWNLEAEAIGTVPTHPI